MSKLSQHSDPIDITKHNRILLQKTYQIDVSVYQYQYNNMLSSQGNQKVDQDIQHNKIKEGPLLKQSRHLKEWKQRWMVLTKTHLYSFQSKAVYKNPTETIPLLQIQTTKVYYKDQYAKPFTFRVQSKQVNLHMSAKTAEDKWAWMTAIEKMVDKVIHPQQRPDTHNLIRQKILMSSAMRKSTVKKELLRMKESSTEVDGLMKKPQISRDSNMIDFQYQGDDEPYRKTIEEQTFFKVTKKVKNHEMGTPKPIDQSNKQTKIEKNVQVTLSKKVDKQTLLPQIQFTTVDIGKEKTNEETKQLKLTTIGQKQELIPQLINNLLQSPHINPRPILNFTIYLLCEGPQAYHTLILQFCLKSSAKALFSEYLILMMNQQIDENRLNTFLKFMIIIYGNTVQPYFYGSDFKIFIDILLREIEMNRSQLNQYLIMMVVKAIIEKEWWQGYTYRRSDLKSSVGEIQAVSNSQNQFLADQILQKL